MTTKVASDADITLAVQPAPVELAEVALPAASSAVKAVGGLVQALGELTGVIRQLVALEEAKNVAPAPTAPLVVAPVAPQPVLLTAVVDPAKVIEDMEKASKMVAEFKEPALRRYAGAKLVGTFVSAAGVAAGVVGVLAMGVAPSLGAAACLAAPVIKYTIDKICSGWRTESYQSTINKAIKEASGAGSWIEQLAHTKALINIVNKFARPTKDREKIVEKLTEEANKIEDKIRGQKDVEQRTELFPVSHREIHSPKGAGGKLLLVMDLAFYAGTAASIGSFYSEMISYGNQIVSWLDQVYRFFV